MGRWVSLPRPALPHSAPQAGSHPQLCRGCSPKYCNWLWRWSRSSVMHPGPAIPQCPGKRWGQFCIALRHQHDPRWQPNPGISTYPLVTVLRCCLATDSDTAGMEAQARPPPWCQVVSLVSSSTSLHCVHILLIYFLFYFSNIYLLLSLALGISECLVVSGVVSPACTLWC